MELSTRAPTTLTKAVQALTWPSLISTPATSTSLARLGLLRMTASSCSGGDADSSLVSIRATGPNCATSESPSASGAIGSLVLLITVCAVAALVAAVVAWASSNTNNSEPRLSSSGQIAAGCRRLALPSSLLPAWAAVVPSMSIAIVTLPPMLSCAGDAVLLVAVVLLSVGPLMALAFLWRFAATQLTLHAAPTASPPPLQCSMTYARWLWSFLCESRYTWQSAREQQQYAQGVLDDYRRVWYALLEGVLLVVAGTVAGVATQLDEDSCGSLLWLLAAMYAQQLVVCAAARPFMSAIADIYALVMLLLTVTSAILQTPQIQEVDAVNFLNWCGVVLTVIAVVSNAINACRALWKLFSDLLADGNAPQHCITSSKVAVGGPLLLMGETTTDARIADTPTTDDTMGMDDVIVDDALFWDAEGHAVTHVRDEDDSYLANSLTAQEAGELTTFELFYGVVLEPESLVCTV